MLSTIEKNILCGLVHKESYTRECLPFLIKDYFENDVGKTLFTNFEKYFLEYNTLPSKDAILLSMEKDTKLSQHTFSECKKELDVLYQQPDKFEQSWLKNETEKWCQDRGIYLAVLKSIEIIQDKEKSNKHSIPDLMRAALAISFDKHIGHDYIQDADIRFDFYSKVENKIPFGLEMLNKATQGGVTRKTLNCILAPTNAGKTMLMCNFAADYLYAGYNVLYITMEMAEELIAQRIDANLMDTQIDMFKSMPKSTFDTKMGKIKSKTAGKLMIKEYPTGSANVNHFRHLIDEYRTKKDFVPDVVIVDYLNICASSRYKSYSGVNSYERVKAVAEELRGLAVEKNVAMWTATQTNRQGSTSSDINMTDTSDSFGIPMTLDFFIGLVRTEELDKLNQVMMIQLKSRYDDLTKLKRFVIGVDRPKMKFYDLDESAQENLMKDNLNDEDDSNSYGAGFGLEQKLKNKKNFGDIQIE